MLIKLYYISFLYIFNLKLSIPGIHYSVFHYIKIKFKITYNKHFCLQYYIMAYLLYFIIIIIIVESCIQKRVNL